MKRFILLVMLFLLIGSACGTGNADPVLETHDAERLMPATSPESSAAPSGTGLAEQDAPYSDEAARREFIALLNGTQVVAYGEIMKDITFYSWIYDILQFLIDDINDDGKLELVIETSRDMFVFALEGNQLKMINKPSNYETLMNDYIFYYHRGDGVSNNEGTFYYKIGKDGEEIRLVTFRKMEGEGVEILYSLNGEEVDEETYERNKAAYNAMYMSDDKIVWTDYATWLETGVINEPGQ